LPHVVTGKSIAGNALPSTNHVWLKTKKLQQRFCFVSWVDFIWRQLILT